MRKCFLIGVFLSLAIIALTACSAENTELVFSFRSNDPVDSTKEETLYFNEEHEKIVLRSGLKMDSGAVSICIYDTDNEVLWKSTYDKSMSFDIELRNISEGDEYRLEVTANQTKSAELKITSAEDLVKKPEKPEV